MIILFNMCHLHTISWRDLPWWVKAGMIVSFLSQVAFVGGLLTYLFVEPSPLPETISNLMTAVVSPVGEVFKESYALEREHHHHKFLTRVQEYCLELKKREQEEGPELAARCRKILVRMIDNASVFTVSTEL